MTCSLRTATDLGWLTRGEGRGGEGRGGEGREGRGGEGRERGGRERGGRGGREGRDDCHSYYSDGTTIFI